MKFKVGDTVKLVGTKRWCEEARLDIGKIGTVIGFDALFGDPKVEISEGHCPGGNYWIVADSLGIIKVNNQLMFEFMYE